VHTNHPIGTPVWKTATRWTGSVLLAVAALLFVGMAPQAASAAVAAPAFPRLAIWWPNNQTQSAADRARTDWIAFQNYDADHIAELRALNPIIRVLGSTSARELNYYLADYNHPVNVELRSVSTDWILTQVGSKLTAAITNASTSIPVADTTKFAAGEMVLVDHELMHVDSIGTSSLTVTRGQVMPAAAHASGARIASVVANWAGSITFDLSTNCPRRDVGDGNGPETWAEWNARRGEAILAAADWDGLLIDCFESNPHWMVTGGNNRSIDPLRTNVPVTDGYAAFDAAWNTGAIGYGNTLRAAVGSKILIGNGNLRNFNMNGAIFEEFPYANLSLATWKTVFVGPYSAPRASYPEWMAGVTAQNLTTFQVYGSATNYQLMRFGLTSALMNDGYFSYALSSSGHARNGLYWFDEYDNAGAGRGYLGQPTGAARTVATNVWRRDYAGGAVLVNPSDVAVTVQLGGTFRKIKGTQAPTVNDGSLVTAVTIPAKDGIILLKVTPLPAGTLTVAGGVAQVTAPDVALSSTVSGATDMRIDPGNGTFGPWAAYTPTAQVTLAGGLGVNTVRVEYRNAGGTLQLSGTVELIAVVVPSDPGTTPGTPSDPGTSTDPSVPVDPGTPPGTVTETATLTASSTSLSYGQATTLRIAVAPAAAIAVRVEKRTAAALQWVQVAAMTTDANGAAQLVVNPLVTTDYRVVDSDTEAASSVLTIGVQARATIKFPKRTVRRSSALTVSGAVTTAGKVTILLQRSVHGVWRTVKKLSSTAAGRYASRIRFTKRGTYAYRIIVATTSSHLRTTSGLAKVLVR
jgi:hypothetical protein